MSSVLAPDVDLSFPDLELELLEDVSPAIPTGFLGLTRRRLRVRYPDGERSAPFVYDELARRAIDAVIIAAHFQRDGRHWVYLRSALRPPLRFRDATRSPTGTGESGALWELPAGLIEPGEQSARGVLEAGRRELWEELGFDVQASDLLPLGPAAWPCPGVMCERHFFLHLPVRPELRAEPALDGSALERHGRVIALPLSDALALCRAGRIEDAKTELGLRRLAEALAPSNTSNIASAARSSE
jgi:ADP-ribose pyrophosphatase